MCLLGGANLLFWSSFVYWGLVPMGAIATVFHGLFLIAQLVFLCALPHGWLPYFVQPNVDRTCLTKERINPNDHGSFATH